MSEIILDLHSLTFESIAQLFVLFGGVCSDIYMLSSIEELERLLLDRNKICLIRPIDAVDVGEVRIDPTPRYFFEISDKWLRNQTSQN